MKRAIILVILSMLLYIGLVNAQEYTVDNYTVALWHFNEGAGTVVHDETGINNGTINGAIWTGGILGGALEFRGGPDYSISDYVNVSDNPSLRPTNQITVEAWVNIRDVTNANAGIVGKLRFTDAEGYSGYSLGFRETSWLIFLVHDEMSKPVYVETTVPSLNTWHHIAGTYDGQYMKLYVDGDLVASKKQTGSIRQNTDPLVIGRHFGLLDIDYFSGIIDEVRISNVAREIEIPQPVCNCTNLTERVTQLEQKVNELQDKLNNLTNRVGVLETVVNSLVQSVNSLTNIVNNIIIYLTNLPPTLRQRMVCGYMENNNLTSYSDLGLTCEIRDGKRCVCSGVEASCAIADANGDGEINIFDLAIVGINFGKMC